MLGEPPKDDFRQKAEALIAQQGSMDVKSLAELQALNKALRVREVELELRHAAWKRAAQQELRVYRGLAENAGMMVLQFAPDGTFIVGTASTETDTGFRPAELIGARIQEFVHPDDQGEIALLSGQRQTVPAEGRHVNFRWRYKDGAYLRLDCIAYAIHNDGSGSDDRFILVSRGDTDRHEDIAHKTLAKRLELAAEAAGVGIWEWDVAGREPIFWDERMHAIYGLQPGEFDGNFETGMSHVHPEDREVVADLTHAALNLCEPVKGTFRLVLTNGSVRHVESTAVGIFDVAGRPMRVVGSLIDVTERVRQEKLVLDEYQLLRKLVDSLPSVIFVFDTNLRLSLLNDKAVQLLRVGEREEALGKTLGEIAAKYGALSLAEADGFEASLRLVMNTGEAQIDNEFHFRRPESDQELWLLSSRLPLFNRTGESVGVLTIIQNMTERKTSEALIRDGQQRLALATEVGNIGIWDYDPENGTLVWDDIMFELYGVSREDFSGTIEDWSGRLHPDDAVATLAVDEHARHHGDTVSYTFRIVRPDGEVRYLRSTAGTIQDAQGKAIRSIGVNIDITDQMLVRAALERNLAEEKELGELKSRFVSMASHEFRTPLAGILAATESIAKYRERMTDEQLEDRLARIRKRVFFMRDMLEDVLVLTRMQTGRVEFQPRDLELTSLCHNAIADATDLGDGTRRISFRTSVDSVVIQGDERLLRQIIDNLITNALRYSPDDAPVSVELELRDDHVRFTVQDSGIGIPADDLVHLFDPFHRGRNVGERQGTGLGLSIAKYAVDMHDGTIDVQSTVGVGTTIRVTIPRRRQRGADFPDVQP